MKHQVRKRGYFEPAYIKNLLGMMETREFIYLKQVMALVILELWHRIFIDNEKGLVKMRVHFLAAWQFFTD